MKKLSKDEIKKGMRVTAITPNKSTRDRSFYGEVYEVMAVDLPHVVLRSYKPLLGDRWVADASADEYDFAEVSQEYFEALHSESLTNN